MPVYTLTSPVASAWMEDLLIYAGDHASGLVLAIDSNAHSTMYGPDQNARGTEVDDLLFRHGLHVENVGHTPTFQTSLRQSCIDLTATRELPTTLSHWRVDTRYNGSDHNTVMFDLSIGFDICPVYSPLGEGQLGPLL